MFKIHTQLSPQNKQGFRFLTCDELNKARVAILKIIQRQHFNTELTDLKNNKTIRKDSKLIALSPFLSKEGLIRVGGRLTHAPINFNQKFPIVLPANHYITELIVRQEHERQLHAGPQATLCSLLAHLRSQHSQKNNSQMCKVF
jgi:hypothetical protein